MKIKKSFLILSALFYGITLCAQPSPYMDHLSDYIENLAVFEKNQEPGRCYFIPHKHFSLNGNWKFFWSEVPEGIPSDFYQIDFNDRNWNIIPVPSNWEMLGYGDRMFRNVNAPFHVNVPYVPKDYNPTGAYRKTFVLPEDWQGDQIFIRLEKVASASFIWVNGKEVGYNEGAQEPAEYNITSYLKPGQNLVAVHVVKYSDGYYLEGQDYWRLAGIFDDVTLYATPSVRLFDWQVITDLDENYEHAELKVNVNVKQYLNADAQRLIVKGELLDAKGEFIQNLSEAELLLTQKEEKIAELYAFVQNPGKWTAETPHLYILRLKLFGNDNKLIDETHTKIGFKETRIVDGTFYLNGIAIKVNAQNSHMQHPEWGHVMKEEVIRKDFEILKQFNFNAVRTSHYPPVNKYLELANEYGLYVIDEAGIEAHATEWVSEKSEFTAMYRERVRQMVLRDRNYPCILFWSAGNESGEGFNIAEVIEEGKLHDPTRYWMYGGNAFSHYAEDIIGPRYPTPMELEIQIGINADKKDIRPSFMDEYLSLAGNAGGALDEYWRVIYAHDRTIGGAIWDFVSPGITERIRKLTDNSPYATPAHIMGNAELVNGPTGKAIDLSGHDAWVEIYRRENVEVESEKLTLTCDIFPRKLVSDCGSFLTKGSRQFGLQQIGKEFVAFYIYTDKRYEVKAELPSNWEYNWHSLTGIYDGENMAIYIDGKKIATTEATGRIKNLPFPVNVGRNAEIHGCETSVAICDAILDNVGIFCDAITPDKFNREDAVLWLDFEEENQEGMFYSYGMGARTYGSIWPNRTPQPEMWQMKKTVQPFVFNLVNERDFTVEIWNRNHFTSSNPYNIEWMLKQDNHILQWGIIDEEIRALQKSMIRLPIHIPDIKPGAEYRIEFSVTLKEDEVWAKAGHQVAWEQLELPWRRIEYLPQEPILGKLTCERTDSTLIISGTDFSYTFSFISGEIISMVISGKEMLLSPPNLNVWRAPLANELDDWTIWTEDRHNWKPEFGHRTITEQYSYGMNDMINVPVTFEVFETGNQVKIQTRSYTLTRDRSTAQRDKYISGIQTNGFENRYDYTITPDGVILLKHTVCPDGRLPKWLLRIGLTMTLSKDLEKVKWYGRGPEENYPDRKTGYPIGIYTKMVKEMYEPYLIPQDHGLRTDSRWVEFCNSEGNGIGFKSSELFNFNAYPFSTENLTKAEYTYQLEESDGLTFNLDYSTSGVGCTARSISKSYRTPVMRYDRTITIYPLRYNEK